MLLAGNLLKAIGGTPIIDSASFVPKYPRNLPGTVANDLVVPLAPYSKELVRDVFMRIEQPEHILDFDTRSLAAEKAKPPKTIGEFYGRIREVFEDGGESLIIDKTGETQPSHWQLPPDKQKITTTAQALDAIDLIVEQGEGTDKLPTFPDGDGNPTNDELAHYYKFAELVNGRLKPNPDATPNSPPKDRYEYDSNDPVPFDEAMVLPLRKNPKCRDFELGSPPRVAIDSFNQKYTEVLRHLHAAFDTDPTRIYAAVDAMNGLGVLASEVIKIELNDGTRAGPTFEYFDELVV